MSSLALVFARALLLYTALNVALANADDQNCMNGATKIIPMSVSSDNPNKVMTYVRDDPGYVKNLKCKWELRAEDYSKPRQVLLNVTLVDFDTNNATKEECSNSQVDLFKFTFSGQFLTNGQVSSVQWCSNSDAKQMPKLVLANLWNSSNFLTVEFKSDDRQVRSDAKGVEMDVFVMAENYCHRSMLYHNGSCYLVTGEKLTFNESLRTAQYLVGNLVTFPTSDSVTRFFAANLERENIFPFKSPFDFASQKVWIGHYKLPYSKTSSYMNRNSQCDDTEATLVISGSKCNDSSREAVGIAMQVIGNKPVFTCESLDTQLPALIEFTQITDASSYSPFKTCDRFPRNAGSIWAKTVLQTGIGLAAVFLLAISVIL